MAPRSHRAAALTTGAKLLGTWHDRASDYQARRRGQETRPADFQTIYPVTLSPLPCWRHLDPAAHRKACAELVACIETDAAVERADGGRPPVGTKRILAANPHDLPASSDRSPAPFVHASSALMRRAFRAAYGAFVDAFRAAAAALRRGEHGVEFPLAAFPPPGPFVAAAPG